MRFIKRLFLQHLRRVAPVMHDRRPGNLPGEGRVMNSAARIIGVALMSGAFGSVAEAAVIRIWNIRGHVFRG
jgi:hypothetical protein